MQDRYSDIDNPWGWSDRLSSGRFLFPEPGTCHPLPPSARPNPHCLMQDDLQKAYSTYQQALYYLLNPKEDPKSWYGIGILYDRYGSLDHAEEAPQDGQSKADMKTPSPASTVFSEIRPVPSHVLTSGSKSATCTNSRKMQHVHAKDAYERVIADNPGHAKVGSIIRTAPLSRIKNLPSNISRRVLKLILRMPRAGISSTVPTWQVKSKTRHTKPVNKLFIVMDVTPPFGALSVSYTSRSINSGTHWMRTHELSGSIHTFLKSGSTLVASTRAATTRSLTLSMPMPALASSTLATTSSRNACSY
ncbi:hypothetical protein PAXINDRAFT_104042 [Paxillus involutus ATCC 200175]|uniref:Uncharacterized protein n=1 Tax=Paxillus involutus ATCC 200175 TaxID=664439 RepID=A0A0C9SLN4_PAXIN|nr:hypothetical protein PAXINDRAFT_104042 [Paxillus involutus ATCC 200175]